MKMKTLKILSLLLLTFLPASLFAEQEAEKIPAFPGAEGHGRYVTGGRGGAVYHVTSLEDDAKNPKIGTLRYYLNKTDNRTIVFDVSGTIFLSDAININSGNLTIAGQTAPGDGICLAGYPVHVNASNIIIRFLRIRMGDLHPEQEDDALGGRGIKDIIIDHCSCSWSVDECVSFYGDENLTLQWCIVSESLRYSNHTKGGHGYGGIWGGAKTSFHHNFLTQHSSRTPRLGPSDYTDGRDVVDLRNNVIYNYGEVVGAYGGEGMKANIVACYYKPGPGTTTGNRRAMIFGPGINADDDARPRLGAYYVTDNWCSSLSDTYAMPTNSLEKTTCQNNWATTAIQISDVTAAERASMKLSEPLDAGTVTTHTAQVAFEKVLNTAGCSLSRDAIDTRLVRECRQGTYTFKGTRDPSGRSYPGIIDSQEDLKPAGAGADWSAWPTLNSTECPLDTDLDGMPDEWEEAHGLNPKYPLDGKAVAENGYTNLENYLNSLVAHIVEAELSDYQYVTGQGYNDALTTIRKQDSSEEDWISLNGCRVSEPQAPGFYIHNGQKTLIK